MLGGNNMSKDDEQSFIEYFTENASPARVERLLEFGKELAGV